MKKDATVRVVDMDNSACSCGDFVETGYPCRHAMAVCIHQNMDGTHWFLPAYKAETHKAQYQRQLMPVLFSYCLLDPECWAPIPKTQIGRPPKQRIRKAYEGRQHGNTMCARCGELGHNKRNKRCRGVRRIESA